MSRGVRSTTVETHDKRQSVQTNVKLLRLGANLQELPNGIDKSLIVMIAHPLDVLVVSLDAIVELLHELLMFVAIVDRSATQKSNAIDSRPLSILLSPPRRPSYRPPGRSYGSRLSRASATIPENETYAISIGGFDFEQQVFVPRHHGQEEILRRVNRHSRHVTI